MKRKRIVSLILALAMILSAMLGCMTSVSFADADADPAGDTVGPALQDYSIEIMNTDPKTEAGQEFKVTLIFDEPLVTDRYTKSAFYIYLNDTLISKTKFKLNDVTADGNKLILDIVGNNDEFVALYQGKLKISLRSNYYEDIMDAEGNGCSSWTDIETFVPTGLAFEQDASKTVAGDENTPASVTFNLTGDAILRGMSQVQIKVGGEDVADGSAKGFYDSTVPVHTHTFIEGTNANWAANLAAQFNTYSTGRYTMTAEGESVTLTATANGADPALTGSTVIRPYAFAAGDEEAGIPNDAVVQPSLLNLAIAQAEERLAAMSSTQVTPSAKKALEEALAAAKTVSEKDITEIDSPLVWNDARSKLEAALAAAQDNSITTESARRHNGSVSLNLLGGEEWLTAINGVKVGDKTLTADQFTVNAAKSTITIKSLAFDTEGQTTPRLKDYDITLLSDGYDAVTQTVNIEYRGADTFQVRYIDESGNVLAAKTYTEEEIKAMSAPESKWFTSSCTVMGPDMFLAKGVLVQDLIDKIIAEGGDAIHFDPNKTVIKIRTNDSLKYDADADPSTVVNDSTEQNGYFNTISYNDLMRDRYYFPGLYEDYGLGDNYLASGRFTTTEREDVASDPDKALCQPMIAWEYIERAFGDDQTKPTEDDYDDNVTADMGFRFLLGSPLEISPNGKDMVDDNYWTQFLVAYQCFGIDIVAETATVTFNTTPSDADITLTDISGAEMERNTDGTFSVPQTPSQPYTYTISKEGYLPEEGSFTVNAAKVASGITVDAELERDPEAPDTIGPALQDYSIEIMNTDPKTEAGQEIKVTLTFDEPLVTDRYTKSAFYIYLNDTLISKTKFKLNDVTADGNKLILDIVGNNDEFVALYQGKLKISLRSNYYEDIMDAEGNGCSSWTDIDTFVPTGLAFEQDASKTVAGDENTPASVTFKLTGDAILRGMSQVQIKVGDADVVDGSDAGFYDSTVPVHTHNFIAGTNANWAANLANQFNNYTTGKYIMTSDGDTVTLTATANGPDEALTGSTVIRPYAYIDGDSVVQPSLLKQAIEKAEARLAEMKDYKVAPSVKEQLEEALKAAKEVADKDVSEVESPLVWSEVRNNLIAAMEAASDNTIATDSARRHNGSVSVTLKGGDEWIDSISAVKLDGRVLTSDEYTLDPAKKTITFKSHIFDKEGEITPRLKNYTISIMANGFATVSKSVQIEYRGSDTFQVRYIDSEGNVLASNTYTEEEMIAMSAPESKWYTSSCTVMGPDVFLAKGVLVQELLDKLLATNSAITFDPDKTVIKIRTNDSLKYDADADPSTVVNDSTEQNGYFNTISYNDLMRDRYYFPGLYENYGIGDSFLASGRFATTEREDVASDPDKALCQPMIAWEYIERAFGDDQTKPTEDDYDPDVRADMGFRFLLGSPLETSPNGKDMVDDNYWTQFLVAFQCFGIDFVCEGANVTFNTTPKSADVELTDISGKVLTPNEDGTYTVPQTPSQPYTWKATREGYVEEIGSFTVNAAAVTNGITVDVELERDPEAAVVSDVNVNAAENGTVTADKTSGVAGGETVTLTVAPAEGYELSSITAVDENGSAVELSQTEGKYTFTMPEADVTVEASFTEIPPAPVKPVTVPAEAEGGKAAADKAEAAEGDTVTLTLTPDEGFTADGVSVKDAAGKDVAVTDLGNGKYSFVMPASEVRITPAFKKQEDDDKDKDKDKDKDDPCPSKKFTDLDTSKWYHKAVDYALNNGLMNGTGETTFEPNTNMTRAMLVQILYNREGKPAVSGASPFTDVPEGKWFTDAVKWANANGIVQGVGDGLLAPDKDVTRQEAVTILMRYAVFKKLPTGSSGSIDKFRDKGEVASWAAESIGWAVGNGIINGVSETELQPRGTATRAQMAQLLMNFDNSAK